MRELNIRNEIINLNQLFKYSEKVKMEVMNNTN